MRLCRKLYSTLTRGLGDRIQLISFFVKESPTWLIRTSSPHRQVDDDEIEVRFVLDPLHAGRAVDHGPSAENKTEAAAFRTFWGEKAELRRFKDGSILESLIWPSTGSQLSTVQDIVSYLVTRHLKLERGQSVTFVGDLFGKLVPGGTTSGQQALSSFQPIMTAADELEKSVRELEGLPLQLRQIQGASSALSYTCLHLPSSTKNQSGLDPASLIVQFEGSGRWPDDLVAIQRTKVALLLKLGDLLPGVVHGVKTRVGLESEEHPTMNSSFLDILLNKSSFRLRIQNEREQTLNERKLKDKTLTQPAREEAALALAEYKRIFVRTPAHTQAVRTLCTRFSLLSPTVRLLKRWFNSHLLSLHFSEAFIELMTIRTFVQPYPWQAPSSITTGFLRTLLFLSQWDWRVEPLIVKFHDEISSNDVERIHTRFEAWRKIDPGMNKLALFAASDLDPEGVTWTQNGPSKVVATRMTMLARSAVALAHDAELDLDPTVSALPQSALVDHFSKERRELDTDKLADEKLISGVLQIFDLRLRLCHPPQQTVHRLLEQLKITSILPIGGR